MFGNGILTPIEEADNVFSLEVSLAFFSLLYRDNINGFFFKVNHLNLSKYSKMIANSELRDDLDEVRQMHKHEQTSHIIIHMPSLSTSFFWSTSEQNGGGRDFKNEKMCFAPARFDHLALCYL